MLTRSFATCVLAASAAFAFCAPAPVRAHGDHGDNRSLVKLVDVAIEDVDVVEGELVATAELTLRVVGRKFRQTVDIPIDVAASPGRNGACDILNLSLGPIRLNVLGLMVRLDDCEGGPITVDIQAIEDGGILGSLLCDLAGGLNEDIDLQTLYDALEADEQETLTSLLGFLLSDAIGGGLTDCENVATAHRHAAAKKRPTCDLLTLEIPEGVHLDLLGISVDTSGICLDVWARRGDGRLLGNLLCNLSELLVSDNFTFERARNLRERIRATLDKVQAN